MSMAAVAVEGITLLAWSPDRALLMPRIFSDGGKVVTTIPIGDHVDAGDFEAATKLVFFSNGDGTVNIDDLLAVIAAWGPCPP